MPARIALRVRIDANETKLTGRNTGLLENFTAAGGFNRLADFDKASGQRKRAFERLVLAANEKDTTDSVKNHTIGGEEWRFRCSHGSAEDGQPRGCGTMRI